MGLLDAWRRHRLVGLLHDPDPRNRITAVEGIVEMGGEDAENLLLNALNEPTNEGLVRTRIIAALGALKAKGAVPPLLAILTDRGASDRIARRRAAEALGEIGEPAAVLPMLEQLCDSDLEDEELKERIRASLHRIGMRDFQPLLEALRSPDACHRIEAIRILKELEGEEIVPSLRGALSDRHYMVRIEAASALGRHGSMDDIDILSTALKDVNRDVREAAKNAILEIRRRSSDNKMAGKERSGQGK